MELSTDVLALIVEAVLSVLAAIEKLVELLKSLA